MIRVYLGVGSNLGDRQTNLDSAEGILRKTDGIQFLRTSPVYETEPVGGPPQGKYLNAVWEIDTDLKPEVLLEKLFAVERKLGRVRDQRNEPRVMDLDILFYGQSIIEQPGLVIPHPRIAERLFVLKPFADLAPDWYHPVLKKTVNDLLKKVQGNCESYPES